MGGDVKTSRAIRAAVVLAVLPLAGCGTAANLVGTWPGQKVPFGGVQRDVRCLNEARDGQLNLTSAQTWEAKDRPQYGLAALVAADLPLTLVGDVLTWPYCRAYQYINQPTDYPTFVMPPAAGGLPAGPFTPAAPPASLPAPAPVPTAPAPTPVNLAPPGR